MKLFSKMVPVFQKIKTQLIIHATGFIEKKLLPTYICNTYKNGSEKMFGGTDLKV